MDKRYFSDKIVKWYLNHKRKLPWRDTRDPYKIWLSEIILQQTRVTQGLPYYEQFVKRYPTVKKLAAAEEHEILRLWQGLGYYTRARNLHKCARNVSEELNGRFPIHYKDLITLPGIGEYTAAAIASFAGRERVAVVDGNVYRVLARIFGIDTPTNSPKGKAEFATLANELIQKDNPDLHNQAIMEFGAIWCTPKNPKCENCIFQTNCYAFQRNMQDLLPLKLKGKAPRSRYFNYIVFEHNGRVYMKQRQAKDIWTGMFDFILVETGRAVAGKKVIEQAGYAKYIGNDALEISKSYKHVLSHQNIFSKFIIVKLKKEVKLKEAGRFYSVEQVSNLPKPVLISRFLADHYIS